MNRPPEAIRLIVRAGALAAGLALAVPSASGEEGGRLPVEQLEAFGEIFDLVKKHYIQPVDDRELLMHAIREWSTGWTPTPRTSPSRTTRR